MANKEGARPEYTVEQKNRLFQKWILADAEAIHEGAEVEEAGRLLRFTPEQKREIRREMEYSQLWILDDALIDHVKKTKDVTRRTTRINALSDLSVLKHSEAFGYPTKDINDKQQEISGKIDADPVYKGEYEEISGLVSGFEERQCGGRSPIIDRKEFYKNLEFVSTRILDHKKEFLESIPKQPQTPPQQ